MLSAPTACGAGNLAATRASSSRAAGGAGAPAAAMAMGGDDHLQGEAVEAKATGKGGGKKTQKNKGSVLAEPTGDDRPPPPPAKKVPNPQTKANAKLKDAAAKLMEKKCWLGIIDNAPEEAA